MLKGCDLIHCRQELHNVEKFQFQQKRIEEQNKKKRELLTTAIFER